MDARPKFSVIVPTCDRPDALRRCLARLAPGQQRYDAWEVIVTNDGAGEIDRAPFPWARIIRGPRRGPAANRNRGAREAGGEWLAFIDDDCVPDREWLGGYAEAAADGAWELLEGRVDAPGWTGHPLEERVENQRGNVFWSCNIAVRRALFESCGGFDEEFGQAAFEDMEFAARMKRSGARAAFVPGARVEHPVRRLTLRQLWRRRLMLRWYSLYLRKTGSEKPLARVLAMDLAHGLARDLRGFQPARWARGIFLPLWELATFPVIFPYVLWWDRQFQRRQTRRPRHELGEKRC